MRIGIDATNLGGGGGVTHLRELLNSFNENPLFDKNQSVIVFSSTKVLSQLPDSISFDKLTFPALNKNILYRLLFQLFFFDKEILSRCDILFSITGDYIGNFKPVVSMSQNMLLYERDIWKDIKQIKEKLRFVLIYQKQRKAFKNSEGIIFISNYAKNYISQKLDLEGKQLSVIHHGISSRFINKIKTQQHISYYSFSDPFKFIYVSTVHVYKNQCNVVEAIGILRKMGYPVELNLVGGIIYGPEGFKLDSTIKKVDPEKKFIYFHGNVPYDKIDKFYRLSNGIIYASTCENMPIILIESMASGIPIASSVKEPMPEFLKENGFYFDALSVESIVKTLIIFLDSPQKREINAHNALIEASKYSWNDTCKKTFEFLIEINKRYRHV